MPPTHLFLGLDVGGSRTRLLGERDDGRAQIEREGPGANPNRVGEDTAVARLTTLVGATLEELDGIDHLTLAAGISGAGAPAVQSRLAAALEAELARPGLRVRVEVVPDGLIALDAAYDAGSGVIVIAGTGSLVLGRPPDGTILRAGGWGPQLGDAGSGHALGRAGLRAVAAALDGGYDTVLCPRILDTFDLDDRSALLTTVHDESFSLYDAAPIVVEAAQDGDPVAVHLLHQQVSALARQIGWLRDRAPNVAARLTMLGGLTTNAHYREVLHDALRDHVPTWSIQLLDTPPEIGALRRARRLAADS